MPIGHRPLLTLGVLLVVVAMQFLSLGSALRTDHEPPRGAGRRPEPRGTVRRRSASLSRRRSRVRALYFGTYERDYPRNAQVISSPARRRRRRRRAAGVRLGHATPQVVARVWRPVLSVARAERRLLLGRKGAVRRASSSATRATSTSPRRGGSPAAGPSSSTRSSRCTTRSSTTAGGSGAGTRRGRRCSAASTGSPSARPIVVVADTESQARFFRRDVRRPTRAPRRVPRRRRGSALPARLASPRTPFHALFVGKLIPLHGLETILDAARARARDPVPRRRQRPARGAPRRPAGERRLGRLGRVRAPSRRVSRRRAARSGSSARRTRPQRVIPNKAFQAIACATPLVTADTPAARELLDRRP